jgi:hypothetical protein
MENIVDSKEVFVMQIIKTQEINNFSFIVNNFAGFGIAKLTKQISNLKKFLKKKWQL